MQLMDYSRSETNNPSGSFSFESAFTSFDGTSGGATGTGNAVASFMLGYPSTATAASTLTTMMRAHQYNWYQGYYLGDMFQVNSKLTLNYGVRWELPGGYADKHDNATILLPDKKDPLSDSTGMSLKGQLALVNSTDWPHRATQHIAYGLFSPRVGFAYRVTNSTVLRAGYGISYLPIDLGVDGRGFAPFYSPIVTAGNYFVATGTSPYIPVNTLSNPFPAGGVPGTVQQSILQPAGRNFNLSSLEGLNISGPITDSPYAYMQQWNFNIQQELMAGLLFEIGYAGAKGTHLPAGILQLNQLSSSYYSQGSALTTQVPNPLRGKLNPLSPYNGATIRAGQLLRAYPQFGNVQDPGGLVGVSSYHSMQVRLEKRFGAAGIINGNYTWSKFMGNVDQLMGFLERPAIGVFQDFNNIRGEYSQTTFDVPHRAVVSYVLELPVGKGKKFAAGATGVAGGFISGWSVNGIVNFQSGYPLALKDQNNNLTNFFGAGTIRPNRVEGCNPVIEGPAQSRTSKWFDTACFSQPAAFSFGNVARTDPVLRAHGVNNIDFTLAKMTAITEQVKLQFKAEFFNLFNRVQFRVNNTTRGNANFGTVTEQANQPRLVQFALRLVF